MTFRGAADLGLEKFDLLKQSICSKSSYFRRLFEGGFRESQSSQTRLSDVRPWVFTVFISWLYHQTIFYVPERTEPTSFHHTEHTDIEDLSSPDNSNLLVMTEHGRPRLRDANALIPASLISGIQSPGHTFGSLSSMYSRTNTRLKSSETMR